MDGQVEIPQLLVDESPVEEDGSSPTAQISQAVCRRPAYGGDGPGTVEYAFQVTPAVVGEPVGSGLYALDFQATPRHGESDGYGQGEEIILVENPDGSVSGMVGTTQYLTITVDSSGNVEFTQILNIWHDDNSNLDDPESPHRQWRNARAGPDHYRC